MSAESDTAAEATTDESDGDVIVRFEGISKYFGRLVAVKDVSFAVREGEILAIVGDNGAGKSTLMNVLCGVYGPTGGTLYFDGEEVHFSSPSDARAVGIETVYQDLALMNDLDIATNVFMGKFPSRLEVGPFQAIDWEETYRRTEEMLEFLDQDLDPGSEVEFLSGGERQLVAIARALSFDPDVLIFDEPTSALSVAGTELVHDTMRQLKSEGHTQIIVSHSVEDVLGLADRVVVLFQGEVADIVDPSAVDEAVLANLITTGRREP